MDRLLQFDLLIIHVDADIAERGYSDANIVPDAGDLRLPCDRPCPPASRTANALRRVILSWCGENGAPKGVVICIPSKNTEAWVVAMLFPADPVVSGRIEFQCLNNPAARLAQQSKRHRLKKSQRDYQDRSSQLETEWPRISAQGGLSEASRFRADITASISPLVA